MSISWVLNFSPWIFHGSKVFLWVFVCPKFFLVDVRGSEFFFVSICGSEVFSREYFVGSFFLLVVDFAIQRFSVAGCMSKTEILKYISNHVFFSKLISIIANRLY